MGSAAAACRETRRMMGFTLHTSLRERHPDDGQEGVVVKEEEGAYVG
jgi:hypothetical protein